MPSSAALRCTTASERNRSRRSRNTPIVSQTATKAAKTEASQTPVILWSQNHQQLGIACSPRLILSHNFYIIS